MAIKTLKEKYNNPITQRAIHKSGATKYINDSKSALSKARDLEAQTENAVRDVKDLLGLVKDGTYAPNAKSPPPTLNLFGLGDNTAIPSDQNNQITQILTQNITLASTQSNKTNNNGLEEFEAVNQSYVLVNNILPVPTDISVATDIGWESQSAGVLGSAILERTDITLDNFDSKLGAEFSGQLLNDYFEKSKVRGLKNIMEGVTGGDGAFKALERRSGQILNPRENVFFNGVKQREFTMEWNLAPVNKQQVIELMNFLKILHYHALPEVTNDKSFLKYPSVFDVKIRDVNSAGPQGTVLDFGFCALNNITANYTPDGLWASYEGGNPVRMVLTCSFTQLEIPTRDKVDKLFTNIK